MNKPACKIAIFSAFLLSLFSANAIAFDLTPNPILGTEGDSFVVMANIDPNDWWDVSNEPDHPCSVADQPFAFEWEMLNLVDGSANWGTSGDLVFNRMGDTLPPPSSVGLEPLCSQTASSMSVNLGEMEFLEDSLEESTEFATLSVDYCVPDNFAPERMTGPQGDRPQGLAPLVCFSEIIEISIEDSPPPPPALPVASVVAVFSAAEPERDGLFNINLDSPAPEGGLTVTYAASGTATMGSDYEDLSGSVFIAEGQTTAAVPIVVIDDTIQEPTETVVLTITEGSGYTIGTASATIAIFDNDEEDDEDNTVSIAASADAAEPAMNGSFTVTVNPAPESDLTVTYSVEGTATSGADYQPLGGSVTVPAGETSANIAVIVIDDDIAEGPETVIVRINAPEGYSISGEGVASITIADDDMAGIEVNPTSGLVVDEAGSTDSFTVVLLSEPTANVTIQVASSDTTEGTVSPGSLTFTPGNWNMPQTVTVTGVFDDEDDGEVPFTIVLSPAQSSDSNYAGLDPQDVSVTNTGGVPGVVRFVMDTYSVAESAGVATIDIERVGGDTGPMSVEFSTANSGSDNAAIAGEDYQATTATLSWENGETGIRTVEVPILENADLPVVVEDGNVIEDVRLVLTRDGEEIDTATLLIESNVTSDVEGLITDGSEAPNQREIARVIAATCPQGNNVPDFQELCTAIVQAGASNHQVSQALQGATPDDAAAVRSTGMQTTNVQVSAIDGRLGTIRGGGGAGFSASGFSVGYGDVSFTGNLVRDFIASFDQNNPDFMQANVGQSDDSSVLDEFGRWGIWISGRVVFGEKDLTSNQIDYDFDTAGITGGIDYRFTDRFVGGLAVGYANTDADLGANDGKLDTKGYSVSLYGNWFNADRFYLSGSLGWGSNDYDQERNVRYVINQPGGSGLSPQAFNVDQTLGADYDGSQFGASLSAGWDFNRDGWSFGPHLGVTYVDVDVDAYDERLITSNQPNATSGWAVHIDDQNYESLEVSLGFELSKAVSQDWGVLIPQGYVDVVSELEDGPRPVTGRFIGDNNNIPFTLMTDDFEETFVRAGLGLGFIFRNNKSAFVMVDGDFGRDLIKTYYINAGFRWQF